MEKNSPNDESTRSPSCDDVTEDSESDSDGVVEIITISSCSEAEGESEEEENVQMQVNPDKDANQEDDVILDIRSSLLDDYPSDIEEISRNVQASKPSTSKEKSSSTVPPHSSCKITEYEAEIDDELEWPSLGRTDCQRSKKIASILMKEKNIAFGKFVKIPQAPKILGKAISYVPRFTSLFRRNFNQMLSFFAVQWSEREKVEFIRNADGVERFCGHAKLINHLAMKDYDLELIISITHDITLQCLKRNPEYAAPVLELISVLYGKPTKEKLDRFKLCTLYSPARARYFLDASDDANLLGLSNIIIRTFRIERPVGLRREWYQRALAEVHRKVSDGVMGEEEAVGKVRKLMDVAGERRLALAILEPYEIFHARLAYEWFQEGHPPPPPSPLACLVDKFHRAPIECIRVLTPEMATHAMDKMQREDDLYVVLRSLNDYSYDQNALGVVGFTATHWDEAYFIFPFKFPHIAAAVATFAKKKRLHCINVRRANFMTGFDCKFIEIATAQSVGRKRGSDQTPIASILRSRGVNHCNNHFYDMFVDPFSVTNAALRHAAAELYFLANAK